MLHISVYCTGGWLSSVTYHLSHVTCHLSPVTCHLTITLCSFSCYKSPRILVMRLWDVWWKYTFFLLLIQAQILFWQFKEEPLELEVSILSNKKWHQRGQTGNTSMDIRASKSCIHANARLRKMFKNLRKMGTFEREIEKKLHKKKWHTLTKFIKFLHVFMAF